MIGKRIAKGFAIVVSCITAWSAAFMIGAGTLSCALGGINSYAIADIPKGTANGSTFLVADTITNWNQLEGLLASYSTIDMSSAKIHDNNISSFTHLGNESGVTLIPRVLSLTPSEIYPAKILPAYTVSTSSFELAQNIKINASPTMFGRFTWEGKLTYVYDASRNNNVTINHGVQDENAVDMLQYASNSSVFGGASVVGNKLLFTSLNVPDGGKSAEIKYDGVINCFTTTGGRLRNMVNLPMYYKYLLSETFISPVKLDLEPVIVGEIEIRSKDDEGNALEGTSYAVFEDAECTTRVKQYSGGAWLPVDDIETDASGVARASNLKAGRYYIKEIEPAEDYKASSEVLAVELDTVELDLSLDTSSGEGAAQKINIENTVLNPRWNENAIAGNMSYEEESSNYEEVSAANYDGASLFIKSGGGAIKFTTLSDVRKLDGLDKLSLNEVIVSTGSISESYDSLEDALNYINQELISNGGIDSGSARGPVTIDSVGELVYSDSDAVALAEFESEKEAAEPEIVVTGIREMSYGLPMFVLALMGIIALFLLKIKGLSELKK